MEAEQAARMLGSMRLSLGAAAILAPRMVARAFGIDPERNPAGPALGRLFGIRNVALGLALLVADDERERWVAWSLPIDAADAGVMLAGRTRGYLSTRTAVTGALAAGLPITVAALARSEHSSAGG